jgi:hypothetical protein
MTDMVLQSPAIDQDVLHEDQYKSPHERSKYMIHETLKCCRSIGQTEWHGSELKMVVMCFKSSLMLILGSHSYLMKSRIQVHLGKEFSTRYLI